MENMPKPNMPMPAPMPMPMPNMPAAVSPAMTHKPSIDLYNVNINYVPPVAPMHKPVAVAPIAVGPAHTPAASILVLFILLVIISRTIHPGIAKC
jgi:hypothetical protein